MTTTAYRPLTPFRRTLARFSVSEAAKYCKLTLGLWIGFAVPYAMGYPDVAIGLSCSAMLTLALGSTNAAARSYFYQRVASNAMAMPVGSLIIWMTAPNLWLGVALLPLVIFSIVRIKPSLFRMTSISVPMTLVLYLGEHVVLLEQRLIGVMLGMFLGFVIQQLIFPPDHGYLANTLVNDGNQIALAALTKFSREGQRPENINTLVAQLHKIRTDLDQTQQAFKQDLQQSWISPQLQRNRDRLPIFTCYHELFDSLLDFLAALDTFYSDYMQLDPVWRERFTGQLSIICEAHRQLSLLVDLRKPDIVPPAPPLHMRQLEKLLSELESTSVFSHVFLGYASKYAIQVCKAGALQLSELANGDNAEWLADHQATSD